MSMGVLPMKSCKWRACHVTTDGGVGSSIKLIAHTQSWANDIVAQYISSVNLC